MAFDLAVHSFCSYLAPGPGRGKPTKPDAIGAFRMVKAVRGETVDGKSAIPVPMPAGPRRTLDPADKSKAAEWFGESVAALLKEKNLSGPFVFVAVPTTKTTTLEELKTSRTFKLAEAVARAVPGSKAAPLLWFDRPTQTRGGQKSKDLFLEFLRLGNLEDKGASYLLIDDFYVTGDHLVACDAALRRAGLKVLGGFCVARAVIREEPNAFQLRRDAFPRIDLGDLDKDYLGNEPALTYI